jgi:hypothetical protein
MTAKAFCVDYKNNAMNQIANVDAILAAQIDSQARCLTFEQVDELIKIDRFIQVLVRTNNGRFLTAVQNVRWYCDLIKSHYDMVKAAIGEEPVSRYNTDWVRDISIPVDKNY